MKAYKRFIINLKLMYTFLSIKRKINSIRPRSSFSSFKIYIISFNFIYWVLFIDKPTTM